MYLFTKGQVLAYPRLVIYMCLCFFANTTVYAQENKTGDEIANTTLQVTLAVDYNRDGKIEWPNEETPFKPTPDDVSNTEPYVFWLNDDDDVHDDETAGNDVPGTNSGVGNFAWLGDYNYESDGIDGTRDLIDFFPIAIDFHDFFTLVPKAKSYKFRLKHEEAALNIVYTGMTANNSDYFLKEVDLTKLDPLFGAWQLATEISAPLTHEVTSEGIILPQAFITLIKEKNNQGIILAEVRGESSKPLVLEVENAEGHVILTAELPLKLVQVEDMYAQVNIRGMVVKDGESGNSDNAVKLANDLRDMQSSIVSDKNVPASFKADKHLVFLHGFQVDAEGARAWHAEMFKRLFQSGSNAMYVGFSWDSNKGVSDGKVNYWSNVENALGVVPLKRQPDFKNIHLN
jgi:hypothetical protein